VSLTYHLFPLSFIPPLPLVDSFVSVFFIVSVFASLVYRCVLTHVSSSSYDTCILLLICMVSVFASLVYRCAFVCAVIQGGHLSMFNSVEVSVGLFCSLIGLFCSTPLTELNILERFLSSVRCAASVPGSWRVTLYREHIL
jgi:Ni/Fe-hydrogenase subunit HybB-like protein